MSCKIHRSFCKLYFKQFCNMSMQKYLSFNAECPLTTLNFVNKYLCVFQHASLVEKTFWNIFMSFHFLTGMEAELFEFRIMMGIRFTELCILAEYIWQCHSCLVYLTVKTNMITHSVQCTSCIIIL